MNASDTLERWHKCTVVRPVTVRQVAHLLNEKPFQVIAELMTLKHFVNIQDEISDEVLFRIGNTHQIHFRIADQ